MKFSFWPDSIKARVTLSALGVFLLSLWVLAFLTTRILERDISQLVADAQASATSQMVAHLNRELGSRLVALERVAAGIHADMMENPDAVQQLLEAQPLLQDLFNVSVLVTDSTGVGIADVPLMAERIGVNYRNRVDAFAVALDEGRAHIGSPIMGVSTRQPLIPLAVPIRDDAGEVIGALGGAIDLSRPNFFVDLTTQAYGRSGYYSVISKSRRMVVTSSNPDLIMTELPPPGVRPMLDRAIRGEEGSEHYTTMQGIDSLATVQGLEVTDWLIATITPISEAYKPIKDMQRRMTLITLFITVLVGSIIWWVLQRQLKPMLSTVEALGQMTEFDQSWKNLPQAGGSEIDRLIGSFKRLLHLVAEREQETRRFKTMADTAVNGKAIVDLEGNLIYINRFFAEIHGYTPAELIGQHLSIFHTASQMKNVEKLISQLHRDGYFSPSETWHVHRHGTEFPMLMSGVLLKDDHGNPQYLAASAVDMTESKRAEALLKASQELLSETERIGNVGGWSFNIDTMEQKWTDEVYRIHEIEITANPSVDVGINFYTKKCRPIIKKAVQRAIEHGENYDLELEIITAKGNTRVVHTIGKADLKNRRIYGFFQDITERKRIQWALEQKNAELEHFVYSVSHDLKSPLVTVKAFAGLLRQDLLNADQQQINDDLDYIDEATDKMGQLLEALLQYSRIGRFDTPAQTLSADQLVKNCVATLKGILQQQHVQVSTSDLSYQLHGDPVHFGQIWQNLIENAVKYRGDQTHPCIEIGVTQQGHEVVFYVRDNGIGIAPEHKERIFNLFSQLNPGSEGSGLGLALVKKIVSIYHGRIWVESAGEGQGSCFKFTLPRAIEPQPLLGIKAHKGWRPDE